MVAVEKKEGMQQEEARKEEQIEEKSRELILQKSPHLPCFIPCFSLTFCRISAASSFSYSLEFSLLILLPLECVLLENPANTFL
jgi:hypothetical protein